MDGGEIAIDLAGIAHRQNRLGPGQRIMHRPLARRRADQLAGIGMGRVLIDLPGVAGLDHLAGVHHHDAVGDLGHDAQIMGDYQNTHAGFALQFLQQRQNLGLNGHVQRGRGFIRDQQIGLQRQRHRDHQPLPLPARELMRIFAHRGFRIGDPHPAQQPQRLGPRLPARHAMRGHRLDDLPADGIDRVQMAQRILKDHRDLVPVDAVARGRAQLKQVAALEDDLAAGDLARRHVDQVHDRRGRHRLARSAFAKDRQRLAPVQIEADIPDRAHGARHGVKLDRQVFHLQHRLSHSCAPSFQAASVGSGPARCASSPTAGSATAWSG